MPALADKLTYLFPDIKIGTHFQPDDCFIEAVRPLAINGVKQPLQERIVIWNRPEPQPTQAELDAVTQEQIDSLNKPVYTPLEFFDQFTRQQWAAIKQAARTDEQVEWLLDRLRLVQNVDCSVQSVIDGLDYLVSQGLISQADRDRILGN